MKSSVMGGVLFLGAVACGSSTSPTVTPGADGGGTGGDGGATAADGGTGADGATAAGGYNLENCKTSVAADAPAFYKKYFKCVTVANTADGVSITVNGLPPHLSPYYAKGDPNYTDFDARGGLYHANPNKLTGATKVINVPTAPASRGLTITAGMVDRMANTNANEYRLGAAGIATDSVLLFNATARPGDNIDDEKFTFDLYEAHPAPTGEYHYHSVSPGPLEALKSLGLITAATPGSASLELYGIMCDGTVVLGCTELDGSAADGAGLDGQNGHVGDLKDKDGVTHFAGRYHTHVCPAKFTTHKYMPEIQFYSVCK